VASALLIGLAERLQGICLGRGLTVAAAESCTGGLIAEAITSVPGSSGYFRGAIVSYADRAKVTLLEVPDAVIAAHGAVSAQVARLMALAARDLFGATIAVSVTGIAGPAGGSPAKPVGLTYVGLADAAGCEVRRFTWAGDRSSNRDESAAAALGWLVERAANSIPAGGTAS
jgi:nicotinamide-nucleotide amidase